MNTVIENLQSLRTRNITAMRADPWVSSSALQKAIRRGEADIAATAALSLLAIRGAAIFRGFLVIAFEDVGMHSGPSPPWRAGLRARRPREDCRPFVVAT